MGRSRAATMLCLACVLLATPAIAPPLAAAPADAVHVTDDPDAVVVLVAGAVTVIRAGQRAAVPATVGMHLMDGDRVEVPEGGRAVLLFSSGRMETARTPVTIARPEGAQAVGLFRSTVQTLVEVATTDAGRQLNRQGMIRPVPGEPVAIAPRNDVTVLDPRPTLTWFRAPQVPVYVVQLRRTDGACSDSTVPHADRPAWCLPRRFQAGADTVWALPDGEPPLVPGASYEWVVGGHGFGRVGTPMRFRVIDPDAYAALASALRGITDAGLDPAGDGLFLTAVAYRSAGLLADADAALRRLAANGASGAAFHNLRGEVLNALGLLDDAEREFALAGAEARP